MEIEARNSGKVALMRLDVWWMLARPPPAAAAAAKLPF